RNDLSKTVHGCTAPSPKSREPTPSQLRESPPIRGVARRACGSSNRGRSKLTVNLDMGSQERRARGERNQVRLRPLNYLKPLDSSATRNCRLFDLFFCATA